MGRNAHPWFKESHQCYYVKHQGKLVRLDRDPEVANRLFENLTGKDQSDAQAAKRKELLETLRKPRKGGRPPGMWFKKSHSCYYTKRHGKLIRLDPDPDISRLIFKSIDEFGENILASKGGSLGMRDQAYAKGYSEAKAKFKKRRKRPKEQPNKHGLSKRQRLALMEAAGNRCQVCQSEFSTEVNQRACVDHCHETGRIRGIICGRCNCAIGFSGDNPATLRMLANYLEKSG